MSEARITVTKVEWFAGVEPITLSDTPCPHDCTHQMQKVVAWGPTRQTYQLLRCDDCGCHGWEDMRAETERRSPTGDGGFWYRQTKWLVPDPGREGERT